MGKNLFVLSSSLIPVTNLWIYSHIVDVLACCRSAGGRLADWLLGFVGVVGFLGEWLRKRVLFRDP